MWPVFASKYRRLVNQNAVENFRAGHFFGRFQVTGRDRITRSGITLHAAATERRWCPEDTHAGLLIYFLQKLTPDQQ
jgi:hypothetical protein